jgi:hypothetical protein
VPSLVSYEEACGFLGIPSGTDTVVVTELLVEAQSLFEKACGRDRAPFSAPLTGRIEILEPDSGSRTLWLDYPIGTITSIALGQNVAAPDETLNPADTSQVVWYVGNRSLIRTDGGLWRRWAPRWAKVVYNTPDDRPGDARLAIKRRVSLLYGQRGKEGFTSVTRGARSWTIATSAQAEEDSVWRDAVQNHQRNWVR